MQMSKKLSKDQRELKVYTKYAFSKFGEPSVLPEIRLRGQWVLKWGFNCGNRVKIFKNDDSIIIKNLVSPLPIIYL